MKGETADPVTIDAYIAAAPEPARERLEWLRATVRAVDQVAVETIKYRIPTFVLGKNLVHFGAFKSHIGFCPTESGMVAFKEELRDFTTSRGAIQFPNDRPLPIALVRRIVEFRVREIRTQAKPGRKSAR